MDKATLAKLKQALLQERARLLNLSHTSRQRDFSIAVEDLADDSDQTSVEQTQSVVFSLREKETKTLMEIDEALQKMEEGTFGLCEECEEGIEPKRLALYPTSRFCVKHQEDVERKKKFFAA